ARFQERMSQRRNKMTKKWKLCIGLMFVFLAAAPAFSQTPSNSGPGQAEKRDLPKIFRARPSATITAMPTAAFSQSKTYLPEAVFSAEMKPTSVTARIVQTHYTTSDGFSWPQWAQNTQHTGFLPLAGQKLQQILANIVYDPLVPTEMADNGGELL